jgi:hypothetical protein
VRKEEQGFLEQQPIESLEDLQNEILQGLEAEEENKPTDTVGIDNSVGRHPSRRLPLITSWR